MDLATVIAETQASFCKEQGYSLDRFMDKDDPFEAMLIEAGLGNTADDSRKVSRGTAKSKGKAPSRLRKLSRQCGTPSQPLTGL